jgi:hypothetical protein
MVRIDPDVELVEVHWDTREEKDEDLDKLKALIEGQHIHSPFHHKLKIQLLTYVRLDNKIAQDYVMVMAVGAHVAWPYLPDWMTTVAEREETARSQREATIFDGGTDWGPHADFGYSEVLAGDGTSPRDSDASLAPGERSEERDADRPSQVRVRGGAAVPARHRPSPVLSPQRLKGGIARGA